jgi:hypothetical protein
VISFISFASNFDIVLVVPVGNGHAFASIFILHDIETKSVDRGPSRQPTIRLAGEEKVVPCMESEVS